MFIGNTFTEKDQYGQTYTASLNNRRGKHVKRLNKPPRNYRTIFNHYNDLQKLRDFGKAVFLPAGYPNSVTPDYLTYQVLNALQAFCSSLASLISSRATLQGFGVGSASASANDALLLTILLDIYSRLTTIVSAHLLGSSLATEAKKYRFVADILNDVAVVLDTLSPVFKAQGYPQLRVVALCLSASCRALCGIAAGGSKAAISVHFATPVKGKGDLGDLNAKDSSKETVLALFGMLLGSLIVPRLQTAWSTYTTLFILLSLHIAINYVAVTGLVLRTMNWQRMWFCWMFYCADNKKRGDEKREEDDKKDEESVDEFTPTPERINSLEALFDHRYNVFRDPWTRKDMGRVTIGSSLATILQGPLKPNLLGNIGREGYIVWFDAQSLSYPTPDSVEPVVVGYPRLHVSFHDPRFPLLRSWLHAGWICKEIHERRKKEGRDVVIDATKIVLEGYEATSRLAAFMDKMKKLHWDPDSFDIPYSTPEATIFSYGYSWDGKKD
ncbi:aldo-keto reductase [Coprinopsis cinerea AmutBmut pab1-1]|nr:aldo-keto reductase [Coprinopsis cinerea AmutBmut pab1-1]